MSDDLSDIEWLLKCAGIAVNGWMKEIDVQRKSNRTYKGAQEAWRRYYLIIS